MSELASAFARLVIETPSCGYADPGPPGRPRDVFERIEDAAEVHRVTGTAGAVALHVPWDAVEDYEHLADFMAARGLRAGAVHPNLFEDPAYRLGSLAHPDPDVRVKAIGHLLECVEIASAVGAGAQSLWLADGTRYPGQDDLRGRRARLLDGLAEVYAALGTGQELLLAYRCLEPARYYAADLADWGGALATCARLGERAKVLAGSAPGVRLEQVVACLGGEGRLGGVRLDRLGGSFERFLIFVELAAGGTLPRLALDQAHNVEGVEAMVLSVVNLQEAYAKALLVDREALREAQEFGDVLRAHEVLLDAYRTDVRPACAAARAALGAAEDPLVALRQSGYPERGTAVR